MRVGDVLACSMAGAVADAAPPQAAPAQPRPSRSPRRARQPAPAAGGPGSAERADGAAHVSPGRPAHGRGARHRRQSRLPGSGPGGRVMSEDVLGYDRPPTPRPSADLRRRHRPPGRRCPARLPAAAAQPPGARRRRARRRRQAARSASAPLPPAPDHRPRGWSRRSRRRRMLTTFNEVDMTAVMELRARRRDAFKERHGVGLGFMSFFTQAVRRRAEGVPGAQRRAAGRRAGPQAATTTSASPSAPTRGWSCRSCATPTARRFAEIEQRDRRLAQQARGPPR